VCFLKKEAFEKNLRFFAALYHTWHRECLVLVLVLAGFGLVC
jgi:hypothetical protein